MNYKINVLAVVLSVFVLFSCKDKQTYSKIDNETTTPVSEVHKIVVNEFMDAAGYTYLNVSEKDQTYWMAIPNTVVEKGATYFYKGGMVMKDFESKELDKTFDFITFAEVISASEEALSQPAQNPHTHTNGSDMPNPVLEVNIEKAKNGVTVEELYTKKTTFVNKQVIVRGKVVKVNNGIMDRNWVHIVDGTSFENKSDITITTQTNAKVGDTITFKATVVLDKDFGQGYVYPLLLENGEVVE
jgi:hypothetical protein